MPTVAIACSACGKKLNVPPERVGTQADCPACKTRITLRRAPPIAKPIPTPVATPIAKPISPPAAPPIVAVLAEPALSEPAASPFALNVSATPARGAAKSAPVIVAVKPMPPAPPWLPKLIIGTAAVVVLSGVVGTIVIGQANSLISCALWAAVGGGLFAARGFLGKWPTKPVEKFKPQAKHYIISGVCIIVTFGLVVEVFRHPNLYPNLVAMLPVIVVVLGGVGLARKWYPRFVNLALRFGTMQVASFAYVGLSVLLLGSLVSVLANRPDLKNQAEFSGAATSVDPETLELALRERANSQPTSVVPAPSPAQNNSPRSSAPRNIAAQPQPQPQSQSSSPPAGRSAADIARQLAAERAAQSNSASPFGSSNSLSSSSSNPGTSQLSQSGRTSSPGGTASDDPSQAGERPPRMPVPSEDSATSTRKLSSGMPDFAWKNFKKRHGENNVAKVIVEGIPEGLRYRVVVGEKLSENSNERFRYSLTDTSTLVVLSDVADLRAFAAKVDFATLTSIDEASRTITLQADPAKVLKLNEERSSIRMK